MSNVTRDGDTVTVRCLLDPTDQVRIEPQGDTSRWLMLMTNTWDGGDEDTLSLVLEAPDLAALGDACHALAGEPDWKNIARKLRGLAQSVRYAVITTTEGEMPGDVRQELTDALADITDAEWAALEGGRND